MAIEDLPDGRESLGDEGEASDEDLSHKLWPTRVRVMNYQKYDQGSLGHTGLIGMAFIQIMIYHIVYKRGSEGLELKCVDRWHYQ